jgi:hypothetical protein
MRDEMAEEAAAAARKEAEEGRWQQKAGRELERLEARLTGRRDAPVLAGLVAEVDGPEERAHQRLSRQLELAKLSRRVAVAERACEQAQREGVGVGEGAARGTSSAAWAPQRGRLTSSMRERLAFAERQRILSLTEREAARAARARAS